jgi:4-hydroxybenzoate polyprenyltransferase
MENWRTQVGAEEEIVPSLGEARSSAPLCVDLDGTLLKTDILFESLARLLRRRPWVLLLVPVWLIQGRAKLKRELALRAEIDPAHLPYNLELLDHLQAQNASRELWLVTGADEIHAREVARQLRVFSAVIASDGKNNLTGARKLEALQQKASSGFAYAGNSRADLPVWREAREAIAVEPPGAVLKALRKIHAQALVMRAAHARPRWNLYANALRLRQWPKNILVVLPMVTAHTVSAALLWRALLCLVLFSLCASAQYIVNDLMDLESDRQHPAKRMRAFASGSLPLASGFILAPVLLIISLTGAYWLAPPLAWLLAGYFALALAYSLHFKRIVLLDAFVLSGLYILRIVAGHLVTGIAFSEWLMSFAFFLFLSLALSKRWMELRGSAPRGGALHGRGYLAVDAAQVNSFGICSAFLSAVVFLLYLQSERVKELYRAPEVLWLLAPVYLYWLSRFWILNGRESTSDDPVVEVLRDRTSYFIALACGLIMIAAAVDLRAVWHWVW